MTLRADKGTWEERARDVLAEVDLMLENQGYARELSDRIEALLAEPARCPDGTLVGGPRYSGDRPEPTPREAFEEAMKVAHDNIDMVGAGSATRAMMRALRDALRVLADEVFKP